MGQSQDSHKILINIVILIILLVAARYAVMMFTEEARPVPPVHPSILVKSKPMPSIRISTLEVTGTSQGRSGDKQGETYYAKITTKYGNMAIIIINPDLDTGKWEIDYVNKELRILVDGKTLYSARSGEVLVADDHAQTQPKTYNYSEIVKTKIFDAQKTLEEIKKIQKSSEEPK